MVGTSFPYLEFLPKPGQAKGVQIEIDPKRIGLRFPVEVDRSAQDLGKLFQFRRCLQGTSPRKDCDLIPIIEDLAWSVTAGVLFVTCCPVLNGKTTEAS